MPNFYPKRKGQVVGYPIVATSKEDAVKFAVQKYGVGVEVTSHQPGDLRRVRREVDHQARLRIRFRLTATALITVALVAIAGIWALASVGLSLVAGGY